MVYSVKNVHRDESMSTRRDAVDMTKDTINLSKYSSHKLSEEEATFDSGILSGSDLSQTYSGEVDSATYGLSSEYDDNRSELRTQSPLSRRIISSEQFDPKEQMRLSELSITDSGVCTDVSDRLDAVLENYSKECNSNAEIILAKEIVLRDQEEILSAREDILRQIFAQDEDGDTQLHLAIMKNDLRSVYEIIRIVPNADCVNIRNYHSQTCLHLSVLFNMPKITRLLLLAGARADVEDRNGNTALHLACKTNNVACVVALLRPLNAYEEKYYVFRYKPAIVLSVNDLNEYNYDGLSCVHLAAEHKDREVLGQLLMYGADVNISECKGGYTLLHEAVESGDVNLVDYLLQHPGIDINRKNYARQTAYQLASRHPSIRQLLLESGSQHFSSEDDDEDDSDSEESDDENSY